MDNSFPFFDKFFSTVQLVKYRMWTHESYRKVKYGTITQLSMRKV